MKHFRFIYILLAIVFVIFAAQRLFFSQSSTQKPDPNILYINTTPVHLTYATTEAQRMQGLSGKSSLGADEGMLFVFDAPEEAGIWMKDMKFPLDIVWIDENYKIFDVKEHATPESYPKIFTPSAKASYVLEVNDGFLQKNQIKIGDPIHF